MIFIVIEIILGVRGFINCLFSNRNAMALSEPTSTAVNGHHHHDDIQQPNNDQLTFDEVALIEQKYRLPIRDLYRLAVRFYRGVSQLLLIDKIMCV
jgi:hypothetical protein